MYLLISSSRYTGWQILEKHRELWKSEAKASREDLQNTILYATGLAISRGLRAYFVVGNSRFYFPPHCNAGSWVLENISTGLLANPPQPFFPGELHALEYTHLISDWPLLDPLETPYTSLENRFETVAYSGEPPSISFRPGKIVYIPLGWKKIGERERPTGFILLVFGASTDVQPRIFYKHSAKFATQILKKIPHGVLYVDSVDPQLTQSLYDAQEITPKVIYEALGYPYLDPGYRLNPLLGLSPGSPSTYAFYYSPISDLLIQVSTTGEFTTPVGKPDQDVFPGPQFLSMYVNSLDIVLTVLRGGNYPDAYIDWGDGTGEFLHLRPGLIIQHNYPYHMGYYVSLLRTAPIGLLTRFQLFVTYAISTTYQPKEPPENYLPVAPVTTNEELNKMLKELHRWNETSNFEQDKYSDISTLPPPLEAPLL